MARIPKPPGARITGPITGTITTTSAAGTTTSAAGRPPARDGFNFARAALWPEPPRRRRLRR